MLDVLTVGLSADLYNGPAIVAVSIDGVSLGTVPVTVSHATGQVQPVPFVGAWGPGGLARIASS